MKRLSPKTRKAITNLAAAGGRMGNLCFNLSQVEGHYQRSFKECYQEWDDAMIALPLWLKRELYR